MGYSREEMAGGLVNWESLTPPESLPLDEHCMRQLADAAVATPYVKEYVRKDGCRIAVKLFNARDLSGSGEGVALIVKI